MEHKTFPAFTVKIDGDKGIVEHIVAVMGNVDLGDDVLHMGAFTKTIFERGHKIKVLDLHKTDSIMRVIGKPLKLREIGLGELPVEVKQQYPDAVGALLAETQFLMNTEEGRGAFERIKANTISEYSFGYDAINSDYSKSKDGRTVRNLREVRLYEYSPVLWAMNPATVTLSAKAAETDAPTDEKPWKVFFEDGKYRVYKIDADGNKIGEPLGEHDTEEEARAQQAALYANEGKSEDKAKWSVAYQNNLPDNAFLHVEDGGEKDDEGKTVPRSLRHLPYKGDGGSVDLPHLRNAISRLSQEVTGETAGEKWLTEDLRKRLLAKARAILEKETAKYLIICPETMNTVEREKVKECIDDWLRDDGDISIAIPEGVSIVPFYAAQDNKAGRRMRGDMVQTLKDIDALMAKLRQWADYEDGEPEEPAVGTVPLGNSGDTGKSAPADEQAAKTVEAEQQQQEQAGPPTVTPTSEAELLTLIEVQKVLLEL